MGNQGHSQSAGKDQLLSLIHIYIAKCFVRDEVDISILPDLLKLGDLGIQYCLKTEKAFRALREEHSALKEVEFTKANPQYIQRDRTAREAMYALINSDENRICLLYTSRCV